ncbi:MAG: response regulator transcription factor [Actinomycetota bacterium]|nr:response regulator transcription factor [Actinomycetota bacterium]
MLLAERDGPTRVGLRMALNRAGFEVVAEARDSESAVEAALEQRPDIALVSTDLPGGGIDVARVVSKRLPGTKVIVLSPHPGGQELLAAVLAGALGYLSKEISPERLPHALEGVLRGEVALPRQYTQHLLDELQGREIERTLVAAQTGAVLTNREWEILRLLGESASTAQMAQRLSISEVTVRRHVSSVLGKLGVADRASAARMLRRSAN